MLFQKCILYIVAMEKLIPVIVPDVGWNSFRFHAPHCKLKGQLCTGSYLKGIMCKSSKAIKRKRSGIRLVFKCLMIATSSTCSPAVADEKKYLHILQRRNCVTYSLTNILQLAEDFNYCINMRVCHQFPHNR